MAWKRKEAVDGEAVWDMGEVTTEDELKMFCLQVRFTGEGGNEESLHWAILYTASLSSLPTSATADVHER